MNIGEKIRSRREQLKMSADELGEKIGKNRATIYRYESNKIEDVPYTIITKLAEALNLQPSYLMGWDDVKQLPSTDYKYFPTAVSAGIPISVDAITEYETVSIPDKLMGRYAGNTSIYFTHVNGESMNKVFPHGSTIAIKPIEITELKNGDIVVYSNDVDYSVKRFYKSSDMLIFKPESHDPTFIDHIYNMDSNIVIHGKVISYTVFTD